MKLRDSALMKQFGLMEGTKSAAETV